MKNIYDILKDFGIEIPEDKKADFDKAWKENYRTKADFDRVSDKRDEYKNSLENVQKQLDAFKDVDVEDLNAQIKTLSETLEAEKNARAEDARKVELEKSVNSFLENKKFVNTLTEKSVRQSLVEELDKDTAKGKSIEDIFKAITSDSEGNPLENILIDEEQQHAKEHAARFTTPGTGKNQEPGAKVSMSELMKMKNENPSLDISQYI